MTQVTPSATITTPAEQVLSEQQMSEAQICGSRFARNKMDRILIAQDMAASMGTQPTYDQWEQHRRWFLDGYTAENPSNTSAAADSAWGEFAKLLEALFGLSKPKSSSIAAEKKATERSKKREELLAAHADEAAEEVQEKLAAAYQTAAADPTNKVAQKAIKNLSTVLKAKTADAEREKRETIAALKKEIREKLSECEDIDTLQAALAALS